MPPLLKIRTERGQMSAIERRIADFILDNAHLLRDYSSQQLASALGISQSSVVKFSQKLGFKGYPDLKYSIGQDVARVGADPQQAPDEPDSADHYLRLGDTLRRSKAQAEEETRQANPREEIERIVQLLDGAPKLFVYGLGDDGLFAREFADTLPLIPNLRADWEQHPPGLLGTLTLERWHQTGRAVLIGDAAHAMVPFHGQGMNCAFEDCVSLARHLQEADDLEGAFAAFEAERKPNARAIQQMALENYLEMRDRVADPAFLLQRELEQELQRRWPTRFVPHYTMVTFLHTPYAEALRRTEIQRDLLVAATAGHDSLDNIDWATLEAQIHAQLPVLEGAH